MPAAICALFSFSSQLAITASNTALTTPPPTVACDIATRSPETINSLLAIPDIATPAATTGGRTLPEGIPISPQTTAAIETVVQTWLACQNAGQPLRAWALLSDGYLYRLLIRQGVPADIASSPSTPGTAADGGAMLLEIRDARELPDGRFGATIVIAYPAVPMPKTFFFTFIDADDRLLIDGILGEISFSVP